MNNIERQILENQKAIMGIVSANSYFILEISSFLNANKMDCETREIYDDIFEYMECCLENTNRILNGDKENENH